MRKEQFSNLFQKYFLKVKYFRIPITDESVPEEGDFDYLLGEFFLFFFSPPCGIFFLIESKN
jgi:hypothetical protein